MSILFIDEFEGTAPDINRLLWTSPTGDAAFFGRTAIRNPASTWDGSGRIAVFGGAAHLLLSTHNPTALTPGDSFWGSEMDSVRTFGLGGEVVGLEFEARASSPAQKPPGMVTSLFGYGAWWPSSTLHDEIDWELPSNFGPPSVSPPRALTNHYAAEPYGRGHPSEVSLAAGFDATSFHTYTIRYWQDRIEWLVDGSPVHAETGNVPNGPLSVNLNTWAPAADFSSAS